MYSKKKTMKFNVFIFIIILIIFFPGCISLFLPKRVTTDYSRQTAFKSEQISESTHLFTFEGTHYQLGKQLGNALQELGIELSKNPHNRKKNYRDEIRLIKKYDPAFIDYMKGVAASYNIEYTETGEINFLTSVMKMNFACSALYINGDNTVEQCDFMGRNYDFPEYVGNIQVYKIEGAYDIIGHSFMFGYPYLLDGMNEHGLSVIANMVLSSTKNAVKYPYPVPSYSGIEGIMATRILLETCKNVTEARELLAHMPINFNGPAIHLLIGDATGKSMIVEFDRENKGQAIFIEREKQNAYQLMTNFALHTKGYKGNMGYKEGKGLRYEVLENDLKKHANNPYDKTFIENALFTIRMSDATRPMNQGMNEGINTTIRLIYNLDTQQVTISTYDDDFKKDYIIDFINSK